MRKLDLVSSLFWMGFALFFVIESLRVGVGTLQNPKGGFMAFVGATALGILCLILLVQTVLKREEKGKMAPFLIPGWRRLTGIVVSLGVYIVLLPKLGYLLATTLLMMFLLGTLREMRWRWVFVGSILIASLSYLIFKKGLGVQFPEGLLTF